jgi:hypothetical protein
LEHHYILVLGDTISPNATIKLLLAVLFRLVNELVENTQLLLWQHIDRVGYSLLLTGTK